MCDSVVSLEQLDVLKQIERLLLSTAILPFEDQTVTISATVPYTLDYRSRSYLYILSTTSLRLSVEDVAIVPIVANVWTELCFQEGQRLFAPDNTAAVHFLVRATNTPLNVLPQSGFHVGIAEPAYSGNATATASSGVDTPYQWGTNGTRQVQHVVLQNNSGQSVFYAFDQSTTVTTNQIYTLATSDTIFWDRAVTVLHLSSATSVNFGTLTGLTVEGFL